MNRGRRYCALLSLAGLLGLAGTGQAVEVPTPSKRIELAPSALPALLASIPADDQGLRWELANIALDVLLDTYRETLLESTRERPSSAAARNKLARWQQATRTMIDELSERRQLLLVDSAFSIVADRRGQVFVNVNGYPLAITGLGRDDDHQVHARIVSQFCAYNPCPQAVAERPLVAVPRRAGHWQISQGQAPLFSVEPLLRCQFKDLSDRSRRRRSCLGAADDLATLQTTLRSATDRGESIDWPLLAASRRVRGNEIRLILNRAGAFLTIELPYLVRLDAFEWERLVEHLAAQRASEPSAFFLPDAARLVGE